MKPVWDGDELDLGDRILKIVTTPGHTPGSIAVIDVKIRRVFSGDPVQDDKIFMFGIQREMHAYLHSLEKLDSFKDMFDQIYPCHGTCPVKTELIMQLHEAATNVLEGRIEGKPETTMHGESVMAYDVGIAVFLCDH